MRLIIEKNYDLMSEWAANYVAKRINEFAPKESNPFVLGLPTGSSPLGMYRKLIELNKEGKVSFRNVVTFNMDEYVGLSPKDPQSYHYYMQKNLFDTLHFQPGHTHILNGQASDLLAECEQYELAIAQAGGIELFIGGVGRNGHLAFNEPYTSLSSRTGVRDLTTDTRIVNSRFFGKSVGHQPEAPRQIGRVRAVQPPFPRRFRLRASRRRYENGKNEKQQYQKAQSRAQIDLVKLFADVF